MIFELNGSFGLKACRQQLPTRIIDGMCILQFNCMVHSSNDFNVLQIELVPCNKSGKEFAEDEVFVEDPSELVGKEIFFKLKLENGMGLPTRFTVRFQSNYCKIKN